MFSIASTVTKKRVSSPPSPTACQAPQQKPATIVYSSITTTTTTIQRNASTDFPRRRSTFRKILMSIAVIAVACMLAELIQPATAQAYKGRNDRRFSTASRQPCLDEVVSRQRHATWLDKEYGQSPAHRAHHLPQCLADGRYNATQCRTELDLCWCVSEFTGRVVSHVFHPGRAGEVRCNDPANMEDAGDNNSNNGTDNGIVNGGNQTTTNNSTSGGNNTDSGQPGNQPQPPRRRLRDGPCVWAKRSIQARRGTQEPLLGSFEPECTDEGLFERTQCHASTGFCWCVDEYTGERISPAFRSWTRGMDCEAEEFLINTSFRV